MSDAQLRDLADFETSSEFTGLQKLALRYATAMTATPVEVPAELVEELKTYLSNAQLVELTSAIAWEQYRARFDHALGIEAEGFQRACSVRCRRQRLPTIAGARLDRRVGHERSRPGAASGL